MNEWPMSARMRHVADWLKSNLSRSVTIAHAAGIVAMSERNLLRCFRAEFGIAPSEYLTDARLTSARAILVDTGLPADSIARRCGLTDGARFARLLKQRTGQTPIEYRRSQFNNRACCSGRLANTAMDITKIPAHVLNDIRERGHSDEAIARMTAREAFAEYCEWNGLIRWGDTLFSAVEAMQRADGAGNPKT